MPIPPPATTCPLAPRRRPSAICHPPAAAVPATSWPICAFPGPIPGGKACPDSTTKCSHKDSHQLAHLRIRQCNSWRRDPPDRTTNDSHEGHQLVLQTELIDLHPACHKTATRSARHTHRKKRDAPGESDALSSSPSGSRRYWTSNVHPRALDAPVDSRWRKAR